MNPTLDQLRRCSVAFDIGAARTRVYLRNTGLVVDEPSVVAVDIRTGALIAVGARAEQMAGRTPEHIRVVRPVSNGTIVDISMAQRMLKHLLGDKLRKSWRRAPMVRAAVCMPNGSDPLAQRAATETLFGLGARRVELVDTLISAAVGCGMPVEHPEATMIVVCGAGTTQIAVLSLGSIVAAETVPVGGDAIDHAVVQHLRSQHELMLPSQSVRPLHHVLGTTGPTHDSTEVYGRDVVSGLARTVLVETDGVRHAMRTPLTAVLDAIGTVLRRCPRPGRRPRRPRHHARRRQRPDARPRRHAPPGHRHPGHHRRTPGRLRGPGPRRHDRGPRPPDGPGTTERVSA